jgi:hypothetical protein
VRNNFSEKEVEDRTYVEVLIIDFEIGHTTDPNPIGGVHLKLSLKNILSFV